MTQDSYTPEQYINLKAELTARLWLNVQKGQPVIIRGDSVHTKLAQAIADAAKELGASEVHVRTKNPREELERIAQATPEELGAVDERYRALCDRIAASGGGVVTIDGPELPGAFGACEPSKLAAYQHSEREASRALSKGIMSGLLSRCLLPAPTAGWAKLVYPELGPEAAFYELARTLDKVCSLTADDPEGDFLHFDEQLEGRRNTLQALGIRSLKFQGPGTDLVVGLSPKHRWLGGRKYTADSRRIRFYANVPIGEIFTTPDYRTVEGTVRVTVPTFILGKVVRGLEFEFRRGELVQFTASENSAAVGELLSRDVRSKFLGEIALVGDDSPLSSLSSIFYSTLIDEKMRCHLAIGAAYLTSIFDGEKISQNEMQELGINSPECKVHHDVMISSSEVDVLADLGGGTRSESPLPLITGGKWAI